jgi:hypothetical protein
MKVKKKDANDRDIRDLRQPGFICIDRLGNIFITEAAVRGVTQYSPLGQPQLRCEIFFFEQILTKGLPSFTFRYGLEPDSAGEDSVIKSAKGLAIDEESGQLYVVDSERNRILVFDAANGKYLRGIGKYGNRPGLLWIPVDISITSFEGGPAPLLFVSERLNCRLVAHMLSPISLFRFST